MKLIDIKALRNKYPTFTYNSYHWDIESGMFTAGWDYLSGDLHYQPSIQIKLGSIPSLPDKSSVDNFVFHLGLAELFSYWKATISPRVIIKAGKLSNEQINWWEKLHLNGMGQFFYENDITDFKGSFHWESDSDVTYSSCVSTSQSNDNLIMLGGGKDSVVTAQILTENKSPIIGFAINPTPAVSRLAKKIGIPEVISIGRVIEPRLLSLNKQDYLNGHIPFSASLAFYATLVSYLRGFKNAIVSNEASAQEENIIYQGFKINHQYSKTLEFELDFQNYFSKYLTQDILYFSFLRPLYELQIAGLFSRYPHFFSDFRSCNVGQNTDSWCGNCPKCLSIYLLLGAFVGPAEIIRIFGTDLLDNPTLIPIFQAMIEEGRTRPFECIGTRVETILATSMISKKYQSNLPLLIKYFKDYFLPNSHLDLEVEKVSILQSFNKHSMPDIFSTILQHSLPIELQ